MRFKKTLALTETGDIKLDERNRVVTLDGRDSVVQELKVRLATSAGEDPFDRELGIQTFDIVGLSDEILEREVRFTLTADDRVRSVEDVTITTPDDATKHRRERDVSVTVQLVDETVVEFRVGELL